MMTPREHEAFEKMREAIANVIAVVDCLNPDRNPAREYHLGQPTMNKLREALALAEQVREQPKVNITEGVTTFNLPPVEQLDAPEPSMKYPAPSADSPPERIYLQWHGSADRDDPGTPSDSDVTWSRERVFASDYEYRLVPPPPTEQTR